MSKRWWKREAARAPEDLMTVEDQFALRHIALLVHQEQVHASMAALDERLLRWLDEQP